MLPKGRHYAKLVRGPYLHKGKNRWYVYTRSEMPTEWARVVMEGQLCRELLHEEVVHHLNRDSTDDRPENLIVISQAEHALFHPEWGNWVYTDDVLLDHLRGLRADGFKPTAKDVDRSDGPSVGPYYYRFGSLTKALQLAGIEVAV